MAQPRLGRYLQAILPHDLSWMKREGSSGTACHLAPAGELGGEVWVAGARSVSVRLHQGCLRTDVLWCVRSSTTHEGRRVYQWLEAFRGAADSDLEPAACQSLYSILRMLGHQIDGKL